MAEIATHGGTQLHYCFYWSCERGTIAFPLFPGGSDERIHLQCRRPGFNLWAGRFPGEENGYHGYPLQYSCLENFKWTVEPGGLQSMESQRVRHSLVTSTFWSLKQLKQTGNWNKHSSHLWLPLHLWWAILAARCITSPNSSPQMVRNWCGQGTTLDAQGTKIWAQWSELWQERDCGQLVIG